MKKAIVFLSIAIFAFSSCQKNVSDSGNKISQHRITEIANKYNLIFSTNNIIDTTVRSENELINLLDILNNSYKDKVISFGDSTNIDKSTFDLLNTKLKNTSSISNSSMGSLKKNSENPSPSAGYKYSHTVYFNNKFPALNYYVTINYNTNGAGAFTGAQIFSGTWGYGLGSYSQTNVNYFYQSGSLVFLVAGSSSLGIGIGSWNLGYSGAINFTGQIQLAQGSGGLGGDISYGMISQIPPPPKNLNRLEQN